jgi:FG-GAP-like repeat
VQGDFKNTCRNYSQVRSTLLLMTLGHCLVAPALADSPLTFAPQIFNFGSPSSPDAIAVADINGDGKPDLIAASSAEGAVFVRLGTTQPGADAPTFAAPQMFATEPPSPFNQGSGSAVAADINGDGNVDLIIGNGSGPSIAVLLNTTPPGATTASFAAPQFFAVAGAVAGAADVNGDGKPDLLLLNGYDVTISLLINSTAIGTATASFAPSLDFYFGPEVVFGGPSQSTTSVTAVDVNGDGKTDLVVAVADYFSDDRIFVLPNISETGAEVPSFGDSVSFPTGRYPASLIAVDINGDGRPDLVMADSFYDTAISVLINATVPGSATPDFAARQSIDLGSPLASITAYDFNGDGKPDLIASTFSVNSLSLLRNTTAAGAATPSFIAQQAIGGVHGSRLVASTDVNGDGKFDLVTGAAAVLLNTTGAPGINLDQHGITGSWFNPATGGQGLEIELYPDLGGAGRGLLFGGWFTYSAYAEPYGGQRWYALEGGINSSDATTQLGIYAGRGGNFDAPPVIQATQVGSATLRFTDCNNGLLSYFFDDGRLGTIPLTRLTANITCSPTGDDDTAASSYLLSGSWFDVDTGGQGLVFDVNPAQNVFFAAWYTYASNGQQIGGFGSGRWYTIQAPFAPGTTAISDVPIYTDANGIFNDPTTPKPAKVGTVSITFQSCSQATLVYAFDLGFDISNNGMTGTINLTRIGPTPPGCSL